MATKEELESMPKALREQYEAAHKAASLATASPEAEVVPVPQEAAPVQEEGTQPANDETNEQAEKMLRLEHSLRVLQGKYNAETGRMRQQIEDQKKQIDEQTRKIGELTQQLAFKPEPVRPEDRVKRYGLNEDEADYGDDAISLSEKIATGIVDEKFKKISDELEALKAARISAPAPEPTPEPSGDGDAMSQTFYQVLNVMAPNWSRLNNDQGFMTWMNQTEPLLGTTRINAFDQAVAAQDATRVSAFFNEYERTAKKTAATPSIANQVMPNSTGSSQATADKPTFTIEFIDEFKANVTRGKYSQGQAEKMLAQIRAAAADNRIRA